jgi:NitT/TauT family transport system ATP-binding protein
MTVQRNAEFGLTARGVPKKERSERAMEYLSRLGLADFRKMYPHQLSGGMKQRVNLARAFANDPSILLMDEPLAALDEQTKMVVQADLLALWQGTRKTVVFITHSLDEAVVLGDRVVVMTQRPGRIKAVIPVELPRPRNAFEIRNDPQFLAIRKQVWEALRSEIVGADDA